MSFVERLPSRNISFQSAQMLTVSELRQEYLKRSMTNNNTSVRITGTLVSHDIDGHFIRITDPLAPKSNPYTNSKSFHNHKTYNTPKPAVYRNKDTSLNRDPNSEVKQSTSNTVASTPLSKPSSSSITNPYLKTPSSSTTTTTTTTSTLKRKLGATTPSRIPNSTRKIISIQKKRHTSLLERSKKHTTIVSKKRALSAFQSPNPPSTNTNASTIHTFNNGSTKPKQKKRNNYWNAIIVDVSSVSTSSMKIGELVMIIGEMQCITFSRFDSSATIEGDVDYSKTSSSMEDWEMTRDHDHISMSSRLSQAILDSAQWNPTNLTNAPTPSSTSTASKPDTASTPSIDPSSTMTPFSESQMSERHMPITQLLSTTQPSQSSIDSETFVINKPTAVEIQKRGGFVAARILQNVNGTDMKLMHQALLLRRKYYQR